jgi:hypothetical protein
MTKSADMNDNGEASIGTKPEAVVDAADYNAGSMDPVEISAELQRSILWKLDLK